MKNLLLFFTLRAVVLISSQSPHKLPANLKYSPKNDELWKQSKHPSFTAKAALYSKQGYYLSIDENGKINGKIGSSSPDIIVEVQSFGVKYKKIRKPNSWYLAFDKNGTLITQMKDGNNTLFYETVKDDWWSSYQSDRYKYMLALRKNGKVKNKMDNKNSKRTKFLIVPLKSLRRDPEP